MKQSIAASVIAACFCAAGVTNETFAGGETATAAIPLDNARKFRVKFTVADPVGTSNIVEKGGMK